ncbi:MAG: glycosyl transferase family 1 [Bacteroidetes bacterium HGW-Bacteroidetes-12]|nr:MAG: glycosyl transferase family 1 [Bacteroidetes bacterium HGW-Bacteroidetes-12]
MKIVIIGPAYPYRGGIALFTERLAQQFIQEKHEVEIITFTLQYPSFLFPGKTQFSDSDSFYDLNISRKINSINPFSWIKVGKQLKQNQPDMVIFNYWMPFMAPCFGTIASISRKNKITKCIALAHNIIPHEKRIGDRCLTKFFTSKMDAFLVLSQRVFDDLNNFAPFKPKKISPHPLYDNFGDEKSKNNAQQALNLASDFKYILFFGIIRKYKGLDILLEAFADERIDKTNIKLIIAGEFYEDEQPYLDLMKKLNIQEHIILINEFIADNQVANYFCAVDIVAQPYKNATQSGVTQIAYHFNKPMLVTDVGGLKEMVSHQKVGYVVEPNSNAVANALVDFFNNHRENDFIEGVKQEKEKYNWNKLTEAIHNLKNAL